MRHWLAPGLDGLPFEVWKNIKDTIVEPFTEMCKDMINKNPEKEWPNLLGILLHKKNERTILNNYRLLCILDLALHRDSDLRWRAKALFNRMMTHCQHFILNT